MLKSLRWSLLALMMVCVPVTRGICQDEPAGAPPEAGAPAVELKWQKGEVVLPGNLATLRLPSELRFLDGPQSQMVLEQLWGNPPDAGVLGMIFPADAGPMDDDSWGVVISYDDSGHVDDADAASIDYNELLASMKAGIQENNEARKAQNYQTIQLVGWAAQPHYDSAAKKLYWAKELSFEGEDENTLNYSVRVLGRHGYLELNAVADMSQLPTIEKNMPNVISAVEFNQGLRYADFDPKTDKLAEYGIAALIAGGVAAKTGLFKGLIAAILAAKKLVIVGVVALFAFLAKLFGFRKGNNA
jgi:uncharacterized membrane-anchored protein